ncbi:major facilitator superfamily domain-containing protein [Podospora fimiseda]|uniref:Major facilitator superfamily domain-containing protein n=1 Tax=Podospora fimiseda TaxID=252190 RepID=A0AAN7BY20_9PEZI|nr:major facilitator superfamily domain-containing protein [Podospora fimiseda]
MSHNGAGAEAAPPEGLTETSRLLVAEEDGIGHPPVQNEVWVLADEFKDLPWWKRPSVWFLLVPYALFTLAFGGTIVPKFNLIVNLVCKNYYADRSANDPNFEFNNDQCFDPDVQKEVALFNMVMTVLTGIVSSMTAPKIGSLSDRYGRKSMLTICALGGISAEIITILAAKFPETVHYKWMILGAFFDGLTGSFTAGSVLIHAYTSDCTPPSKRGVAIGYLHACLFMGLAFGPLLAAYFAEWTGSLLSIFYITLGCHTFWVFSMAFITPESLTKKRQLLAREKYALERGTSRSASGSNGFVGHSTPLFGDDINNMVHAIRNLSPFGPLSILFPKGNGNAAARRNLLILAFIDVVVLGAAMSSGTVILLYTGSMFGWRNLEGSRFMSGVSMVRVFVLLGIFPVINYFFRTRKLAKQRRESGGVAPLEKSTGADDLDLWILRTAIFSDVLGMIGYVVVRTAPLFVASAVVTALGGLGSATIQSALSKHVPAERVGQLLGGIGLLHALTRVVAPILFNGLYAATVETYPQAVFVMLATLFGMVMIASLFVRPHVYMTEDDDSIFSEPSASGSTEAEREALEDEELLPRIQ